MTPNEINLTRTATGWMASYVGPHAAKIKALFGTVTIPTAFTASASYDFVSLEICKLNPGVLVGRA